MPFHPDQLLLYAVTDRAWTGRQTLLEQLEAALQGGVTLVQLREKDLDPAAFLAEALEVKALCRRYHVPLILNDQVDLALACGADGVHVGSEDLPVAHIRRRAGPDFIIGATAKTVQQAQAAQADAERRAAADRADKAARRERLGITEQEKPASQVGNRRFARGRAYVEDRYENPEEAEEATIAAAQASEGVDSIDPDAVEDAFAAEAPVDTDGEAADGEQQENVK